MITRNEEEDMRVVQAVSSEYGLVILGSIGARSIGICRSSSRGMRDAVRLHRRGICERLLALAQTHSELSFAFDVINLFIGDSEPVLAALNLMLSFLPVLDANSLAMRGIDKGFRQAEEMYERFLVPRYGKAIESIMLSSSNNNPTTAAGAETIRVCCHLIRDICRTDSVRGMLRASHVAHAVVGCMASGGALELELQEWLCRALVNLTYGENDDSLSFRPFTLWGIATVERMLCADVVTNSLLERGMAALYNLTFDEELPPCIERRVTRTVARRLLAVNNSSGSSSQPMYYEGVSVLCNISRKRYRDVCEVARVARDKFPECATMMAESRLILLLPRTSEWRTVEWRRRRTCGKNKA